MASTSRADTTAFGLALALAATLSAGCSSDAAKKQTGGVTPPPEGQRWQTLAEWHVFKDAVKQVPSDRVIPYEVNAQLFSDYAYKYRFMYVPEGTHIKYQPKDKWELPVGAILVKTFAYLNDPNDPSKGQRLLETRLLVHESTGWEPMTYIWDEAQTTATLARVGGTLSTHFIDPSGTPHDTNYTYPSRSECRQCHGSDVTTNTLGGRTRQLERTHDYGNGPENQIDHLASLGFFESTPEPAASREHLANPFDASQPLVDRVRGYFDANCSHCHQPGVVAASSSGLWLDYPSTDPSQPDVNWGVCKHPTSAGTGTCGYSLDVVPGDPDHSILMCRMNSTAGIATMPPLGRTIVHTEGVALMREWIAAMAGSCGGTQPVPDGGTDSGVPQDAAGGG